MDPLDIILHKENIAPFYQPVISCDEHIIAGYEVLGHLKTDKDWVSLGPFFRDGNVPAEYKWEIDEQIYNQAFAHYLTQEEQPFLFLNVDANVLDELDNHELLLNLLFQYEKQGLPLKKIVLEFREHDFQGDIESLSHLMKFFTTNGIQVAIDDLGKFGSNLDRLSKLEPNMMKIDLEGIGNHESAFDYRNVLEALAIFSRKIGATLLFKGIEDLHHLHIAWGHGGRFIEGGYLHKPGLSWISRDMVKQNLDEKVRSFIHRANSLLQEQIAFVLRLDEQLANFGKSLTRYKSDDEEAKAIAEQLSHMVFRVYMCERFGYQLTSNWKKDKEGKWYEETIAKGKNWSWRSYFLENVAQMESRKTGILSDVYRDIETNELVRTYSYPLSGNRFVFLDIDPFFLFEREWLL
ncbi:EAL domain-containing protein [Bacillus sp. H-16]|uniref:EAL domain-containing protein n=1 Tax=Alteribacter salitolerans TaxID=2912333 RepID=UPI00196587B3|nr:EAL-associated domain-containing protein [Alteribacter salitolerans]MBM7094322.1 EAL domain-containing protein [Alteribacter salitolerans]